jgi:hypothetical protein
MRSSAICCHHGMRFFLFHGEVKCEEWNVSRVLRTSAGGRL